MSDWGDATWNENGELVIDIYNADSETLEPVASIAMEDDEENEEYDKNKKDTDSEHTYATIDCGGECGGCVALIVDGDVVAGPPFHPNCHCSLDWADVKNAKHHKSHLHEDVGEDRNSEPADVLWLKESLEKLELYEPDKRAGETDDELNPYPNQRLFAAIEKFRKLQKIKETGAVKPGHWTEVKINEALSKQKAEETNIQSDIKFNQFIERLKQNEGGYIEDLNRIDQPTNIGITEKTLDFYNAKHPEENFPNNLQDLTSSQATQIYRELYYENKRIEEIDDMRIAFAVMDIGVMTSPKNTANIIQDALNDTVPSVVKKDGIIGTNTIKALNRISENQKDLFLTNLIARRLEFLRTLPGWNKYGDGWADRTMRYLNDF